jgi:hypothetical protein|tara:strand:+ start:224 stop:673 length:450 start_codon:yes stop_codon:yes gene_type:complete
MKKTESFEGLDLAMKSDYKTKEKDVEKLFKEREIDKVELLKEGVEDIQQMIADRTILHKEILENLTKIDTFINNSMPDAGGASTEAIKVRQDLIRELLKKKIELDELKVNEKQNYWRDVAALKKELREHMKEFRDMESKTSMLDSMLEM